MRESTDIREKSRGVEIVCKGGESNLEGGPMNRGGGRRDLRTTKGRKLGGVTEAKPLASPLQMELFNIRAKQELEGPWGRHLSISKFKKDINLSRGICANEERLGDREKGLPIQELGRGGELKRGRT